MQKWRKLHEFSDLRHYLYNGHGDVTALLNSSGAIAAQYYYDAFGVITEETAVVNNPFRYAGYEYEPATGLYYLKSRHYDPAIARFMQGDTYRGSISDPLSLNLYTYCSNEPVMYWDPTGHWQDGDEKYDSKTQATIAKATTDYYNAPKGAAGDAQRAAANAAATPILPTDETALRELQMQKRKNLTALNWD